MHMLKDEIKREYVEAVKTAPALVREETPPVDFLRTDDFNPLRASRRLAMYWKNRKHVFGQERWLRPMSASIIDDDGMVVEGEECGPFSRSARDFIKSGILTFHRLHQASESSSSPEIMFEPICLSRSFEKDILEWFFYYVSNVDNEQAIAIQTQGVTVVDKVLAAGHELLFPAALFDLINEAMPMKLISNKRPTSQGTSAPVALAQQAGHPNQLALRLETQQPPQALELSSLARYARLTEQSLQQGENNSNDSILGGITRSPNTHGEVRATRQQPGQEQLTGEKDISVQQSGGYPTLSLKAPPAATATPVSYQQDPTLGANISALPGGNTSATPSSVLVAAAQQRLQQQQQQHGSSVNNAKLFPGSSLLVAAAQQQLGGNSSSLLQEDSLLAATAQQQQKLHQQQQLGGSSNTLLTSTSLLAAVAAQKEQHHRQQLGDYHAGLLWSDPVSIPPYRPSHTGSFGLCSQDPLSGLASQQQQQQQFLVDPNALRADSVALEMAMIRQAQANLAQGLPTGGLGRGQRFGDNSLRGESVDAAMALLQQARAPNAGQGLSTALGGSPSQYGLSSHQYLLPNAAANLTIQSTAVTDSNASVARTVAAEETEAESSVTGALTAEETEGDAEEEGRQRSRVYRKRWVEKQRRKEAALKATRDAEIVRNAELRSLNTHLTTLLAQARDTVSLHEPEPESTGSGGEESEEGEESEGE